MVAIIFTTAIAVILIPSGDTGELADTTVLLLLLVFTVVNISVLVLRRNDAAGTTSVAPVLGALVSIFLNTQTTWRSS
jgi:APA family basic amino acid/polyamine antiporter